MTAWCADLQERRSSARTVDAYRRDLLAFLADRSALLARPVGPGDLAALASEDFAGYLARLSARGRAPASIARALATLRNFFRFLDKQGLVHNPNINRLAAPRVPAPVAGALSGEAAEEAVTVIAQLSDAPWIARRDEALFALLYGSGLKLGEALGLKRGEAPRGEWLTLVGADHKRRTVPVLPFVPALIADYLRCCPHTLDDRQPLFVGVRGKPLNPGVVQRQMRRLRALLGLPAGATPKTLRQCFALRLRAEGGDLRAIQTLLGHAHLTTTQRCVTVTRGSPKPAAD